MKTNNRNFIISLLSFIPWFGRKYRQPTIRNVPFNYNDYTRPGHGGTHRQSGLTREQVESKHPDYRIRPRTLRFPNAIKRLVWMVTDENGNRFQVPRQYGEV